MRHLLDDQSVYTATNGRADLEVHLPEFQQMIRDLTQTVLIELSDQITAIRVHSEWSRSLPTELSRLIPVGDSTLYLRYSVFRPVFDVIAFSQWLTLMSNEAELHNQMLYRAMYRWILRLRSVGFGPVDMQTLRQEVAKKDVTSYWMSILAQAVRFALIEIYTIAFD